LNPHRLACRLLPVAVLTRLPALLPLALAAESTRRRKVSRYSRIAAPGWARVSA
jgi:hypothetical protein